MLFHCFSFLLAMHFWKVKTLEWRGSIKILLSELVRRSRWFPKVWVGEWNRACLAGVRQSDPIAWSKSGQKCNHNGVSRRDWKMFTQSRPGKWDLLQTFVRYNSHSWGTEGLLISRERKYLRREVLAHQPLEAFTCNQMTALSATKLMSIRLPPFSCQLSAIKHSFNFEASVVLNFYSTFSQKSKNRRKKWWQISV